MSNVVKFPPRERGDAFTAKKLQWIEAITLDGAMTAEAMRLATVLAIKFLSRRSGCAFPSQKTLGDLLGIKERQVRRHMTALIEAGYVAQNNRGRNRSNEYRMALPTGHQKTAGTKRDRSSEDLWTGRGKTGPGPVVGRPPNPLREPIEKNPLRGRPPAAEPSDWCSTLEGSRGKRLEDASPPAPTNLRQAGDVIEVDGERLDLLREEDEGWLARSMETGLYCSVTFDADGIPVAKDFYDCPF